MKALNRTLLFTLICCQVGRGAKLHLALEAGKKIVEQNRTHVEFTRVLKKRNRDINTKLGAMYT